VSCDAARVLLVDDHPVVRSGLAGLLQDEGFDVVGIASTEGEALELLARAPTDLAVVDLTLEHGSGFDVLATLQKRFPATSTVVYSVHEDGNQVRRALEAGAKGYVTKREDPEVLVQCLRRVRSGERFLSPRAARGMADALAKGPSSNPEQVLSPQELQVYGLTGRGLSAQGIAEQMDISVRTVETYYGRILTKLNLPGRRELRQHATEWARGAVER
jgi:DNA-binding NarL/FixJ family response regulator